METDDIYSYRNGQTRKAVILFYFLLHKLEVLDVVHHEYAVLMNIC